MTTHEEIFNECRNLHNFINGFTAEIQTEISNRVDNGLVEFEMQHVAWKPFKYLKSKKKSKFDVKNVSVAANSK